VIACLEEASFTEFGWKPVVFLGFILGGGGLGWLSWRHYVTVLERAEWRMPE
jgi:hypothetical protein